MAAYAVMLESFAKLPYREWGRDVAEILGVHPVDANTRLRRQQGMVWDGLDQGQATALAAFLIEHGHPAGLVAEEDIAVPGRLRNCRNADVVQGAFELEDPYGHKTILAPEVVELAQAGWIEEEIDSFRGIPRSIFPPIASGPEGMRVQGAEWSDPQRMEPLGWVLHLYCGGDEEECVRIVGQRFNYDYQGLLEGGWQERFGRLLADLGRVLPDDCLDAGYRLGMGLASKPPEEARYDSLDSMVDRAIWTLTLKRFEK
jgi:hypothetical protein